MFSKLRWLEHDGILVVIEWNWQWYASCKISCQVICYHRLTLLLLLFTYETVLLNYTINYVATLINRGILCVCGKLTSLQSRYVIESQQNNAWHTPMTKNTEGQSTMEEWAGMRELRVGISWAAEAREAYPYTQSSSVCSFFPNHQSAVFLAFMPHLLQSQNMSVDD